MSSIQINFVIASEDPFQLARFYAHFNGGKVFEGLTSSHYFIYLRNGCKIQFYKPSKKKTWPKRGWVSSLLFQKDPSKTPKSCLEEWISNLILLGAEVTESPREEIFGYEALMNDPEGNRFLILVPKILSF